MNKDYYKILGLDNTASDEQIKRAFRKLAFKFHPDRNLSPDAKKKFREVYEAYEILRDPGRRKNYDNFGDVNELVKIFIRYQAKRKAEYARKKAEYIAKKKAKEAEYDELATSIINKTKKIIFFGLVLIFVFWLVGRQNTENILKENTDYTIGVVTGFKPGIISNYNASYVFYVNNKEYEGTARLALTISDEITSDNGMPLILHDRFTVRYSIKDPSVNELLFDQPTKKQLEAYFRRSQEKCIDFLFSDIQINQKRKLCECLVENVYDFKGIDGLATIYFHRKSRWDNFRNNSRTFKALTETEEFRIALAKCTKESSI